MQQNVRQSVVGQLVTVVEWYGRPECARAIVLRPLPSVCALHINMGVPPPPLRTEMNRNLNVFLLKEAFPNVFPKVTATGIY